MSGHDQYSHHNAERKGEKQVQEELEEEKNNQRYYHTAERNTKTGVL
jgi:hypothetical protein